MKYLRTQTTIYEVEGENEKVYLVKAKKDENNIYSKSKINTFVVAVSDKLEDLCDEFDIIVKGKHHHYYNMEQVDWVIDQIKEERVYINDETIEKVDSIYGAIWTDKGLIYVAKMNEQGELYLL